MSVLSVDSQQKVEAELVASGVLSADAMAELKKKAELSKMPFLSVLTNSKRVSDEQLTKAIAGANNVPYVHLEGILINKKTLRLLSQEIAERYMAVPLGEMNQRLVVAMLDAYNVQAVDFLSNKTGRGLKVYAASETGIRYVLKQYQQDI